MICIREIPELHIDKEKVLSYRIRFPAIGVRTEVVVAEFSTFYARRRFCAKISDTVWYSILLTRPGSRGGHWGSCPPPRHHAKDILLSHILHKIKKKKCVSLAQLLLPGVNNQPFGHDSCCYLNHLL